MKATRARYGVVGFAISLAVLSYIQRVAISQAAGPISHDLQLHKAQMEFVFGAFGLSYALFELPAGLLGDRLGVRRILSQIVLGWSIFTAGAAWNVTSLWIVRFRFGAGAAGCFPNLTRMLSVWLPARERVSAQSLRPLRRCLCCLAVLVPSQPDWWQPALRAGPSLSVVSWERRSCCSPSLAFALCCPRWCRWSRQFLQRSDHADFLGRQRGNRGPDTATVAAAMNMMGNFAGFVAPVLGGLILQRTGGDWNPLIYLMVGAAMNSALSWIYLDPESGRRKRETNLHGSRAQISAEDLEP